MAGQQHCIYKFGPFRLDAREHVLRREGEIVQLSPKVLETLLVLIQNGGRVISKSELIDTLWPDSFVEESSLSQNISLLRKSLAIASGSHSYIETIPKRGYRFSAEVETQLCEHAGGEDASEPATASGSRAVSASRSVGVLPFKSLTPDTADEYIGVGMADAIITRLSNINQIIVRPTGAVIKYAGLNQDPVTVGRELQVESVLEGSIRRQRDQVRVTVQIVSVRDKTTLWAGKFDGLSDDIFSIEDKISEQVTQVLMLSLTGEEQQRLTRHHTESPEASRLYVKGVYYTNKATKEGAQKGIEYYKKAIDLDPDYALAYAGLADAYCWLSHTFLSPSEAMSKARATALKALEIDDTLGEAHFALAQVKMWHDWEWEDVELEFKKAIGFNPNLAAAHLYYGFYLTAMGRFNEAAARIKLAQEIDPLSLLANSTLGWSFYYARKYDQAIDQWEKTLEMDPNFLNAYWGLGWAYNHKGEYGEAIAQLKKAMSVPGGGGPEIVAALGYTYALYGNSEQAAELLDGLKELSRQRYVSPYYLALVYLGLGEKGHALDCLEKSFEDRFEWLVQLKVDPTFEVLHPDQRFKQLLRRLRLG